MDDEKINISVRKFLKNVGITSQRKIEEKIRDKFKSGEIKDINNLNLSLSVNGEERQRGNTKDMIFGFNFLVSHISKYVELFPGTIISTGTPSGTGMEQNPPKFLKIGDKISLKVDFLGQQNQTVISD